MQGSGDICVPNLEPVKINQHHNSDTLYYFVFSLHDTAKLFHFSRILCNNPFSELVIEPVPKWIREKGQDPLLKPLKPRMYCLTSSDSVGFQTFLTLFMITLKVEDCKSFLMATWIIISQGVGLQCPLFHDKLIKTLDCT